MPVIFHTSHINKSFTDSVVWNTLYNNNVDVYTFLEDWDIHVWPLSETNTLFFEHIRTTSGQRVNPDMPSGVTGKYRIDLYLHDSKNEFKQRENSDRIMHEVSHAILYGTTYFVSGVHRNVNNRYKGSFWYWNRFKYSRFTLSIIDIRQYL